MANARRWWAIGGTIAVHAAAAWWLSLETQTAHHEAPRAKVRIAVAEKRAAQPAEKTEIAAGGGGTTENSTAHSLPRAKRGAKVTLSEGTGPVALEPGSAAGIDYSGSATIAGDVRKNISLELPIVAPQPDLLGSSGNRIGGVGNSGKDDTAVGRLKPKAGGEYAYDDSTFEAKINRDGTVEIEDKLVPYPRIGVNEDGEAVLEIPLDLTDTIMRIAGEDPYGYEKRKFLAETQELRGRMAEAACQENLDDSLLEIRPRLDAIWNDPALSLPMKKKKLFAAWDECAEDGPANVLKTSEMIRASIVAFINEHLPPTSTLAFSRSELTALNEKRMSKAALDPYADL